MVFEKRTQRREDRAEAVARDAQARQREWEDTSVFPMGIPMLPGPGSIASAMLLMSRADNVAERLTVLGALAAGLLLSLEALLAAPPLMRLLGSRLEALVTRIVGVVLAALHAQFVIDGLGASFS